MRKVILFNLVTLDGFFEGPKREIDWHNVDEEFNQFAIQQLNSADTLIFGRVTYELMVAYWPTPMAIADDSIVAGIMNSIPKIVFSRTLNEATWNNTRLVKGDAAAEIMMLRQQPGKDLFIFGSADLAETLLPRGLVDEIRVIVNPILLGEGKPLFRGLKERIPLKLVNSKVFKNGNVLLYYQPDK